MLKHFCGAPLKIDLHAHECCHIQKFPNLQYVLLVKISKIFIPFYAHLTIICNNYYDECYTASWHTIYTVATYLVEGID